MTTLSVPKKHRRSTRKIATRTVQYVILSILVVLVIVPVIMLVFGALKTRGELMSHPYTLPIPPRWENIVSILTQPTYSFWHMLRNSLVVMVATTFLVVIICSLAAFVFARMEFRSKGFFFNLPAGLFRPAADRWDRSPVGGDPGTDCIPFIRKHHDPARLFCCHSG
jgi:ABC-type glycerol-3-phosphate transport system permease component